MNRRTCIGAAGAGTALGTGYLAYELLAPEQATAKDEDRTAAGAATVVKTGDFTGTGGHRCSGTVELAEDADGLFL
jgi:hypothetical protein